MATIAFAFGGGLPVALEELEFSHPLLERPRLSRRGKTFMPGFCEHSFQWSAAVRALTVLCLKSKGYHLAQDEKGSESAYHSDESCLSGGAGTLAASLDYALSKQPLWLHDMFGSDANGISYARRLFCRWNSERKRGGKVRIALNSLQLPASKITVTVGPLNIDDAETCFTLARLIEVDSFARESARPQRAVELDLIKKCGCG